ncbi:MAG: amino acid ABC transporter permease [Lachnospiraceae bacterium]|nr:amino acid ABC transporter permease [Lachnospiraceae bacterium]
MSSWLENLQSQFILNFVEDNRWFLLVQGVGNTILITAVALLIGVVLGALVAMVRSTFDKNGEDMKKRHKGSYNLLFVCNAICKFYLTVIRGTPVVVQLMIAYFIIFASSTNGIGVAMIAFGINSGAYVAEIIRGGIMSIDEGQFEAGRSLGFSYAQTMNYIIIPQVFKVVLPTLCNEFIVLIKETSVAGYVGIRDLTKSGDIIRGRTYSPYMPLFAVALIYLFMVLILEHLLGKVERSLRKNER